MWISGGGEASGDQLLIHPDIDLNFTQYTEKMDLKEAIAYRGITFFCSPALMQLKIIYTAHVYLGLLLTKSCHLKTL